MRNDVKGLNGVASITFILPKALEVVRAAKLKAPTEDSVRQTIKAIDGATTDVLSRFTGERKVCCVRISTQVFSNDMLDDLTDCMWLHLNFIL